MTVTNQEREIDMLFKRSLYFWQMTAILIGSLLFKTKTPVYSLVLWLILPLTIATWVSWILGDIIISITTKEYERKIDMNMSTLVIRIGEISLRSLRKRRAKTEALRTKLLLDLIALDNRMLDLKKRIRNLKSRETRPRR